jgi:hypothetical protein
LLWLPHLSVCCDEHILSGGHRLPVEKKHVHLSPQSLPSHLWNWISFKNDWTVLTMKNLC